MTAVVVTLSAPRLANHPDPHGLDVFAASRTSNEDSPRPGAPLRVWCRSHGSRRPSPPDARCGGHRSNTALAPVSALALAPVPRSLPRCGGVFCHRWTARRSRLMGERPPL